MLTAANGNHKDANWRFPKGQIEGKCGEVSRIYFNNITATADNGCFIGGDEEGKVIDIYFNNVRVGMRLSESSTLMDKRPCKGEGFIRMTWDAEALKAKAPVCTENASVIGE